MFVKFYDISQITAMVVRKIVDKNYYGITDAKKFLLPQMFWNHVWQFIYNLTQTNLDFPIKK